MSSHLAASSKSPPRRVIMPALPLQGRSVRSAANPPSSGLHMDDLERVSSAVGNLTIDNGAIASDPTEATVSVIPPTVTPINGMNAARMRPAEEDDVFGASVKAEQGTDVDSATPGLNTTATPTGATGRTPQAYRGFTPRPDRVVQLPNAANAQGLYPPDALIFVANLSNQLSADQLETSCHQAFDAFGPCHIKVRLDKNRHPFAFVQFENVDNANAVVSVASDMFIDGRKVRIERAKAERAVILSRQDGTMVPEDEARDLMSKYGPIELCVPTHAIDRSRNNMASGVYVKFAYYLDCRDALRSFSNHTGGYNLYMAPALEPRIRQGPTGSPIVRGFCTPRSAVDQKSIYVGNLPEGTTRQDLEELFKEFGVIVQVNVIKKDFAEDSVNIFGFVEFSNPREAERASLADRSLHGVKLRIEPKEYSARRPQRTGYFPNTPVRQNTPRSYSDTGFSGLPISYANQDMYPLHQMSTPPSGYNQSYSMLGFNSLATGQFSTPPSHSSMNNMSSIGIFSPPGAHDMDAYSQRSLEQYNSPMYGGPGHMMGPISEHGEEEY